MTPGAAAGSITNASVSTARRHHLQQRRERQHDAPVARPNVEDDAPGLRDQNAAHSRLDMPARALDQRCDQIVVVVMLDAQKVLRLRERQRLDGRRDQQDGGHAASFGCDATVEGRRGRGARVQRAGVSAAMRSTRVCGRRGSAIRASAHGN
jgi:hypothetical protein